MPVHFLPSKQARLAERGKDCLVEHQRGHGLNLKQSWHGICYAKFAMNTYTLESIKSNPVSMEYLECMEQCESAIRSTLIKLRHETDPKEIKALRQDLRDLRDARYWE
jgi:hypothetical protein